MADSEIERRESTLQTILIEIGTIKTINQLTHEEVKELKERVGIQNGKVNKFEIWKAEIRGSLAVIKVVIVALVLPVAFIILKEILSRAHFF